EVDAALGGCDRRVAAAGQLAVDAHPTRATVVVAVAGVDHDRLGQQAAVVDIDAVVLEARVERQRGPRGGGERDVAGRAGLVLDPPVLVVAVAGLVGADVEAAVTVDVLDAGDRPGDGLQTGGGLHRIAAIDLAEEYLLSGRRCPVRS